MRMCDQDFANEAANASCGDYAEPNEYRAEFLSLARQAVELQAAFARLMFDPIACEIFNDNSKLGDVGDITATLMDIEGDFNRAADAQEDGNDTI